MFWVAALPQRVWEVSTTALALYLLASAIVTWLAARRSGEGPFLPNSLRCPQEIDEVWRLDPGP